MEEKGEKWKFPKSELVRFFFVSCNESNISYLTWKGEERRVPSGCSITIISIAPENVAAIGKKDWNFGFFFFFLEKIPNENKMNWDEF